VEIYVIFNNYATDSVVAHQGTKHSQYYVIQLFNHKLQCVNEHPLISLCLSYRFLL